MKKVLSILIAVVMCVAFSTMALAADEAAVNTEELSSVVGEIVDAAGDANIEDIKEAIDVNGELLADAFGDLIADVDTVAFDEAADYVITSISELTGADLEDVRGIVMEAINDYDLEKVEIVETSEIAGFVDSILERLEDLGIDKAPILEKLKDSKLANWFVGIYVPETTTAPTTVPSEIVETGHASSVAAFAVLAVAAAGAFVCTRKKAE